MTQSALMVPTALADLLKQVAEFEQKASAEAPRLRVQVLRDCSLEQLGPFLRWRCFAEGLKPEVVLGNFDSIQDDLLNESGALHREPPDIALIALHAGPAEWSEPDGPDRRVEKTRSVLRCLSTALARSQSQFLVTTLVAPPWAMENKDKNAAGRANRCVADVNTELADFARQHPGRVFLCDMELLVRRIGDSAAFDRRSELRFAAPYRPEMLAAISGEVMRLGYALKGKSRKCLVLDCDNTLWGGVVGEEGLDGIALDPVSRAGSAYHLFQHALVRLQERGILLALCSKNEETDVFEVFDRHPYSVLKRTHFAAWRINWQPKSVNLHALARELNLLPESLVFIDDNPAEIAEVASHSPSIATLLVPTGALHLLPEMLSGLPQINPLGVSVEDRRRTEFFVEERERRDARGQYADELDYLRSLEIKAVIHPMIAEEVPRVAQLTQKTNQFNLTTRRYSEPDIRAMLAAEDKCVFTLSAKDKYGDYGLTGVLIASRKAEAGEIDTMLLSCRVLSRRLETALVKVALRELGERWGCRVWLAEYRPSKKNAQVSDFWLRMGFEQTGTDGDARKYRRSKLDAWEDVGFIRLQ